MNEWSNDQAKVEGWQLHAPSGAIMAYGWTFVSDVNKMDGLRTEGAAQKAVMAHITERAQAGSAYHIEALARHYFRET